MSLDIDALRLTGDERDVAMRRRVDRYVSWGDHFIDKAQFAKLGWGIVDWLWRSEQGDGQLADASNDLSAALEQANIERPTARKETADEL